MTRPSITSSARLASHATDTRGVEQFVIDRSSTTLSYSPTRVDEEEHPDLARRCQAGCSAGVLRKEKKKGRDGRCGFNGGIWGGVGTWRNLGFRGVFAREELDAFSRVSGWIFRAREVQIGDTVPPSRF